MTDGLDVDRRDLLRYNEISQTVKGRFLAWDERTWNTMAQRRMFSLSVVDTDRFLSLPVGAQCLYFHLGMRADDDGFVAAPRKIMSFVTCTEDDFRILIAKGFVIPFESGVCVIRDWKENNYIQKDRYHPTRYVEEKQSLSIGPNGAYIEEKQSMYTGCIQNGY